MSGAGARAAERDGRLACCVREGERGRRRLAESATTYRTSSSMRTDKILISVSDDATRATHGGGVPAAISSASRATSSNVTYACVGIMALMWGGRLFIHKDRRKSGGTDEPGKVQRWRGNCVGRRSPISSYINIWRTRCSSESTRRFYPVLTACGWGWPSTSPPTAKWRIKILSSPV